VCNGVKDDMKDLMYYADDYNKRNFAVKPMVSGKIKTKINEHINSLASYTRLM